jgi:acetyl esterase/lipase
MKPILLVPSCTLKARLCAITIIVFSFSIAASSQQKVIPLWPGVAPGSENWTQHEQQYVSPNHTRYVRNVTRPTLTAYLPAPGTSNGTAVVICPGGGFHFLVMNNEGSDAARWLNARGVTAFVLKYRLIPTTGTGDSFLRQTTEDIANRTKMDRLMRPIAPLVRADGQQAIKLVRRHAAVWKIATNRIGIMGFSAGGFLTADVALHHDSSSRPDFAAAIYPALPHPIMVPADAPPMFVVCASDDPLVPPLDNGVLLYTLWKLAGIPAELHVYAQGGHGFGMRKRGLPVDHWIDALGAWLGSQGFLQPRP